jgi:hypothetical protein
MEQYLETVQERLLRRLGNDRNKAKYIHEEIKSRLNSQTASYHSFQSPLQILEVKGKVVPVL